MRCSEAHAEESRVGRPYLLSAVLGDSVAHRVETTTATVQMPMSDMTPATDRCPDCGRFDDARRWIAGNGIRCDECGCTWLPDSYLATPTPPMDVATYGLHGLWLGSLLDKQVLPHETTESGDVLHFTMQLSHPDAFTIPVQSKPSLRVIPGGRVDESS